VTYTVLVETLSPTHSLTHLAEAINDDLQSLNFGIHTAGWKAKDRDVKHQYGNVPP